MTHRTGYCFDPKQIIAAIPQQLGYIPHRSVVAVALAPGGLADRRNGLQLLEPKASLACPLSQMTGECAAGWQQSFERSDTVGVAVVVVDDRIMSPANGEALGLVKEALTALDTLARGFSKKPPPIAGWAVPAIVAGAPYWGLSPTDEAGVLEGAQLSIEALLRAPDGSLVRSTREEMTHLLASDPERAAQVAAALPDVERRARDRYDLAIRHNKECDHDRRRLEHAMSMITVIAGGESPTGEQLAELAVALRRLRVHHALHVTATVSDSAPAENLWIELVRTTTGRDRAAAATLLCYSAFQRWEFTLAIVALHIVHDTGPAAATARLIHLALRSATPPHALRYLAHLGAATAAELGIDVGPYLP